MTTTITNATQDAMMDSLNSSIGTSHKLKFYTSGDVLLGTCTYSAAQGVVSASGGKNVITYAHLNYTDDSSADATGTCEYAIITTSADAEQVRFSEPVNDIGLSSASITAGGTIDVDTDIVIESPAYTV